MKVGVVTLNWNSWEFTTRCVESILGGIEKPEKIIIIDNASSDRSPGEFLKKFKEVEIIYNERNIGFASGCNIGIRILLKRNFDYIWLINNDTVVKEDCLKYLLIEFEQIKNISVTTGKVLLPLPDKIIWYGGANFNYWTLRVYHRGKLEKDVGQYDHSEDVPFVSGCCMLVRSEAFRKVGLFDENFYAYSEDFDWCLRARKLGLRFRYVPKAVLYHWVSVSIRKNSRNISGGSSLPLAIYLTNRNRLYIIRKHASNPIQWVVSLGYSFAWFFFYSLVLIFLFRIDKLKALFKGIKDGLFDKIGTISF